MNLVDAESWRAMVDQASVAGLPITRRSEGGLSRVFVGPKAAWVEVRSVHELVNLSTAAAAPLSVALACTNRYGLA